MSVKKVLLVDDDLDIIAQNSLVLKKAGYEVIAAYTGKEAVAKLKTETVDVIVLDVIMEHHRAGFEFARSMTAGKNTPIILLTSDGGNQNWLGEDGATWSNIVKILDKPVAPEKLLESVKEAVG